VNLHEWLICIIAALTIVVAAEVRKLIISRREPPTQPQLTQPSAQA
jgi:hypothetical protein